MTPEEYQWHIKLVKSRYGTLNLTVEQAEKLYKYEQENDVYSKKYQFSAWEEWDYELTIFKEILNAEQFHTYQISMEETIQRYTQQLIEEDTKKANEIVYLEEQVAFYENEFLPGIVKGNYFGLYVLSNDKHKIEYLRAEYKHILTDAKKKILLNHFRHNRLFMPSGLKASLLRHKLLCILPDYMHFQRRMDKPTKAIADYLTKKVQHIPDETTQLLAKKFQELTEFNRKISDKYFGESRGWHLTIGQLTEAEEKVHQSMTMLLLDPQKYGF